MLDGVAIDFVQPLEKRQCLGFLGQRSHDDHIQNPG